MMLATWWCTRRIEHFDLCCHITRTAICLQVADFVQDQSAEHADAAALAQHCLSVKWDTDDDDDLLETLLTLGTGPLQLVLRYCSVLASAGECFKALPLTLHRQYVQARVQSTSAGPQLAFNAWSEGDTEPNGTAFAPAVLDSATCGALCRQLPLLRDLASVDFSHSGLTGENFVAAVQALACATGLRKLNLSHCRPGRIGVLALASEMPAWPLDDLNLSSLGYSSRSGRVADRGSKISVDTIADSIGSRTALTRLALGGACITTSIDAAIGNLCRLQILDTPIDSANVCWEDCGRDEISAAVRLPNITCLNIGFASIYCFELHGFRLAAVPACSSLQRLEMAYACPATSSAPLWAAMPALEHVDIRGCFVEQGGSLTFSPEALTNLRMLTELAISSDYGRDESQHPQEPLTLASALRALSTLRVLRIDCAADIACPHPQLASALALMSHLHTLRCDVAWHSSLLGHSSTSVQPLTGMTRLQVQMWSCYLSPEDDEEPAEYDLELTWLAQQLPRLSNLQDLSLSLRHAEANDADSLRPYCVQFLSGPVTALTQLRVLCVRGADLSKDRDIALLPERAPMLTKLEFCHCSLPVEFVIGLRLGNLQHLGMPLSEMRSSAEHACKLFQHLAGDMSVFEVKWSRLKVIDLSGCHYPSSVERLLKCLGASSVHCVYMSGCVKDDMNRRHESVQHEVDAFNRKFAGWKRCVFSSPW